jgi:predicted XRE-type DNA-binding protein
MPFVMVSTAGSLEYLRSYGFQTFNDIWDESYDLEKNDQTRLSMIADLLIYLDRCSEQKLQSMFDKAMPIIEFNYNHFYNGGFEKILWNELTNMLEQIKQDFND